MNHDLQIGTTSKLLYCGSEGLSLTELIDSLFRTSKHLPPWEQLAGRTVLPTFLGRVAIWQLCEIWQLKPDDEILMPAYNCGTEVDPFVLHGCKVVLYRVDEKARIDVEDLMRRRTHRTKVVYITHYFGWPQDIRQLARWCREENLRLVEDCALALFSSGPDGQLGLQGDAAIFSLGKFLPVPAGGLLTLRNDSKLKLPLLIDWPQREMLKRTGHLLRKDFQRHLERLGCYSLARRIKKYIFKPTTGPRTNAEVPDMPRDYYFEERLRYAAMPPLTHKFLQKYHPDDIRERRRENYLSLYRGLNSVRGMTPLYDHLPDGVCPLAFPLIVPDRNELVQHLETHGVCSYPFWEGYHHSLTWSSFPEARYLKDNVLTLPVNQSLTEAHAVFISDFLKEFQATRSS